MGSITTADYLRMLARLRLKNEDRCTLSRPQPEPAIRHEPVGTEEGKTKDAGRFLVRITSFRKRLLDPDNLCPKYFVDALRYQKLIPDDSAKFIDLSISQRKSKTDYTEIEILEL